MVITEITVTLFSQKLNVFEPKSCFGMFSLDICSLDLVITTQKTPQNCILELKNGLHFTTCR
jgi:hypothetical protein